MRLARFLGLIISLCIVAPAGWAETNAVDVALILGADVSRSVSFDDYNLQREGLAAALEDENVLNSLITAGENGRAAVLYFEWAGEYQQSVRVQWQIIEDSDQAKAFAASIRNNFRFGWDQAPGWIRGTSVSGAIDFALEQFANLPFTARRKILDLSSDGYNNDYANPINRARERAEAARIEINALVILNSFLSNTIESTEMVNDYGHNDLARYYREHVIVGPRAFVKSAENSRDFARAIREKLTFELARLSGTSN